MINAKMELMKLLDPEEYTIREHFELDFLEVKFPNIKWEYNKTPTSGLFDMVGEFIHNGESYIIVLGTKDGKPFLGKIAKLNPLLFIDFIPDGDYLKERLKNL
jgi:hypothetical protein